MSDYSYVLGLDSDRRGWRKDTRAGNAFLVAPYSAAKDKFLMGTRATGATAGYLYYENSTTALDDTTKIDTVVRTGLFGNSKTRITKCNFYGMADTTTINIKFETLQAPEDRMAYSVGITGASWLTGVATLTTAYAHGFSAGDYALIKNVAPSGYNGIVKITSIGTYALSYALTANPGTFTVAGTAYAIYKTEPIVIGLNGFYVKWVPRAPIGDKIAVELDADGTLRCEQIDVTREEWELP